MNGKGDISTFRDCEFCYPDRAWFPYHLCKSKKSVYLPCEKNLVTGKCQYGYAPACDLNRGYAQ